MWGPHGGDQTQLIRSPEISDTTGDRSVGLVLEHVGQRARRGSQRHVDDRLGSGIGALHPHLVHQAEVDDVDPQLGSITSSIASSIWSASITSSWESSAGGSGTTSKGFGSICGLPGSAEPAAPPLPVALPTGAALAVSAVVSGVPLVSNT